MSVVQELREREAKPRASFPKVFAWTMAAVLVFAAGALTAHHFAVLPALSILGAPSAATAGPRLGDAANAPGLRLCFARLSQHNLAPDKVAKGLAELRAVTAAFRLGGMVGAKTGRAPSEVAITWALIAECLYAQNTGALCQSDNRALAVEAANGLIALSQPLADTRSGASQRENQIVSIRERIIHSIRHRLRAGELIADDFGLAPPAAIKAVLRSEKAERNACAKS